VKGAEYMTRRAEYRKSKEGALFQKVIEWARQDNQPILVEIVEQAYADDDAENWLTLHPTSSFTGLTNFYFQKITEEKEMLGSEKRLLKKQFDAYCKKLISG
jgi:hypothetical protein